MLFRTVLLLGVGSVLFSSPCLASSQSLAMIAQTNVTEIDGTPFKISEPFGVKKVLTSYSNLPIQLESAISFPSEFSLFVVAQNSGGNGFFLSGDENLSNGMKIGRWDDTQLYIKLNDESNFDISMDWPDQGQHIFFIGRNREGLVYFQNWTMNEAAVLFGGDTQSGLVSFSSIGGDPRSNQKWNGSISELYMADRFLKHHERRILLTEISQVYGQMDREMANTYSVRWNGVSGLKLDDIHLAIDATELEDVTDEFGVHPHFKGLSKVQKVWRIVNGEFHDSDIVLSDQGTNLLKIPRRNLFFQTLFRVLDLNHCQGFLAMENHNGRMEVIGFSSIQELENELKDKVEIQIGELIITEPYIRTETRKSLVSYLVEKWGVNP